MKNINQGIVLITIMLLVSIIIMIAGLLIVTGRNALILGADFSDKEQALYAAESGLAYAQYCISRYADWNGDEQTLNGIYNPFFNEFSVEIIPSSGKGKCIHGVFRNGASEFYITFYDGSWDSTDVRYDKNGVPIDYYSVNNLSNSVSPTNSICFNGNQYKTFRDVPPQKAHVIAEGRSNRARRYAEAVLAKSTNQYGSSFSISAGGMEINLTDSDSVFFVNSASNGETKIRSLGDIKINSGSTSDKNCFQIDNEGSSCTGKGTKEQPDKKYTYINGTKLDSQSSLSDYGITCDNTSQSGYLNNAKLSWSTVSGDYINDDTYTGNIKSKIKAGTWIYKNSPEDQAKYKLFYYQDKLDSKNAGEFVNAHAGSQYSTWAQGGEQALISGNKSDINIQDNVNISTLVEKGGYLFNISDATGISPDIYGNSDFSLAVYDYDATEKKYVPSNLFRASIGLEKSSDGKDPCLITKSGGNINILGELSGNGKILSGGDISFQGKSMLESDKNSGLSIYSKGSVNISPVVGTGGILDPNGALKAAWQSNITGSPDSSGYYNSSKKKYKDLKDNLLNTKLTGTYGKKSYEDSQLLEILTDETNFNYDKSSAEDMISTLLAKNTYKGNDFSTTHDESIDTNYSTYEGLKRDGLEIFCTNASTNQPFNLSGFHVEESANDLTQTNIYVTRRYQYDSPYHPHDAFDVDKYTIDFTTGNTTRTSYTKYCMHVNPPRFEPRTTPFHGDFQPDVNVNKKSAQLNINNTPLDFSFNSGSKWKMTYNVSGCAKNSETIMMLDANSQKYSPILNNDTLLKGLIYTWGDLYAPNLQSGSFAVRGAVVAYGGDPDNDDPGDNGKGKVSLNNGKNIIFTYDPDYLHLLLDNKRGVNTIRIFHAYF